MPSRVPRCLAIVRCHRPLPLCRITVYLAVLQSPWHDGLVYDASGFASPGSLIHQPARLPFSAPGTYDSPSASVCSSLLAGEGFGSRIAGAVVLLRHLRVLLADSISRRQGSCASPSTPRLLAGVYHRGSCPSSSGPGRRIAFCQVLARLPPGSGRRGPHTTGWTAPPTLLCGTVRGGCACRFPFRHGWRHPLAPSLSYVDDASMVWCGCVARCYFIALLTAYCGAPPLRSDSSRTRHSFRVPK